METTSEHRQKREALKVLSQQVKPLVKAGQFDSVNDALIELFYRQDENREFHTLYDWNKKGYKVIKGSKAFVIWGSPRELKKNDPAPDQNEEEKNDFYPLCYLFSNAQVERMAA